jgi:hypothetical protein
MASNPVAFAVIGWLVPGGGYWLLKRKNQFLFYLVTVLVFFAVGVLLKGGLLFPEPNDLQGMDNVTSLLMKGSAFAKVLAGLPYLAARAVGYEQTFLEGFRFDMGTKLLTLAGLFNLLALADAFSLAFPEKKPALAEDKKAEEKKK